MNLGSFPDLSIQFYLKSLHFSGFPDLPKVMSMLLFSPKFTDPNFSQKEMQLQKTCVFFGEECSLTTMCGGARGRIHQTSPNLSFLKTCQQTFPKTLSLTSRLIIWNSYPEGDSRRPLLAISHSSIQKQYFFFLLSLTFELEFQQCHA